MEINNLPKVMVYPDESFGLDELLNLDISNYTLGYYEIPDNVNTELHEVDNSDFYMDSDEFEAYRDFHGAEEFLNDYEKDIKKFKPMMYRYTY